MFWVDTATTRLGQQAVKQDPVGFISMLLLVFAGLAGRWTLDRLYNAQDPNSPLGSFPIRWVLLAAGLLLLMGVVALRPSARSDRTGLTFVGSAVCLYTFLLLWPLPSNIEVQPDFWNETIFVILSVLAGFAISKRMQHAPDAALLVILLFAFCLAVLFLGQSSLQGLGDRAAVLGGGPNILARTQGLGIISVVYLAFVRRKPALLTLTLPMTATLVLTGSRGAAAAMFLVVCPWLGYLIGRRRPLIVAVLVILGLTAALISYWPAANEFVAQRYVKLTFEERYLSHRPELFALAWQSFLEKPFLGNGPGWFESRFGLYPHNLTLQTLSESGLVGLAMLLVTLSSLILLVVKRAPGSSHTLALMAVFIFLHAQFSGDWFDARMIWLLGAVAAGSAVGRNRCTRMLRAVERGSASSAVLGADTATVSMRGIIVRHSRQFVGNGGVKSQPAMGSCSGSSPRAALETCDVTKTTADCRESGARR